MAEDIDFSVATGWEANNEGYDIEEAIYGYRSNNADVRVFNMKYAGRRYYAMRLRVLLCPFGEMDD
jgi:hypothetical protein